jgi:hypothetical protein
MTFNRNIAGELADSELAQWRQRSYAELLETLDDPLHRKATGSDGLEYNIEAYALPDRGDDLRITVAVDDGGISAVSPVVRDFIIRPDGTLVE